MLLDDRDLTHLPMHARARLGVGYLPQEPSIFRRLTVLQNVMAILETRVDLSKAERRPLAEELLHELHVGHLHDSPGISLSGGERRQVEIARALAARPAFMLLDEPFAGVDPLSVLDIQRIIGHLCERRIGVLITDHNVRETLGICDRAYIQRGPGDRRGRSRHDSRRSTGPSGLSGRIVPALTWRVLVGWQMSATLATLAENPLGL